MLSPFGYQNYQYPEGYQEQLDEEREDLGEEKREHLDEEREDLDEEKREFLDEEKRKQLDEEKRNLGEDLDEEKRDLDTKVIFCFDQNYQYLGGYRGLLVEEKRGIGIEGTFWKVRDWERGGHLVKGEGYVVLF